MKKRVNRVVVGFAALLVLSLGVFAAFADGPGDGFVPLFNGKDLTGWKGDPKLWKVVDGVIVGSTDDNAIKHNTFLLTEKTYSDFILKAKIKLRNHNSGIQFRSESRDEYVAAGYQADFAEKDYSGMLYEEQKRGILDYWKNMKQEDRDAIWHLAKVGDWNEYEIKCQGHHITMSLNGKVTCDLEDPTGALDGVIGLQLHAGTPMMVSFKDLYIKDLKSADAKPADAKPAAKTSLLMPDVDLTRTERLASNGARYRTPQGFTVEEVASNDLVGSVINLTFDYKGRPVVSTEDGGVAVLEDKTGSGHYDSKFFFQKPSLLQWECTTSLRGTC